MPASRAVEVRVSWGPRWHDELGEETAARLVARSAVPRVQPVGSYGPSAPSLPPATPPSPSNVQTNRRWLARRTILHPPPPPLPSYEWSLLCFARRIFRLALSAAVEVGEAGTRVLKDGGHRERDAERWAPVGRGWAERDGGSQGCVGSMELGGRWRQEGRQGAGAARMKPRSADRAVSLSNVLERRPKTGRGFRS